MSKINGKIWVLAAILVLGWSVLAWRAEPARGATPAENQNDKVVSYIRARFGVPDNVKLSVGGWQASAAAPGFKQAEVTVDDGKNQRGQTVLVSDDGRYLVLVTGGIIDLAQATDAEMTARLREEFKVPSSTKVSVGAFKRSPSPEFEEATLALAEAGRPQQERTVLLTRDHKHLILSELYNLGVDPRQMALRTISLQNEASQGPANAPVTIVEYADLECPMCARMHEFLETKVRPRYGDKVRIVFKEFPLVNIHDWSYNAAIATQCAYEINPASYVPLRSAIFRNQQLINIANLRDTLLSLGEQAGVDRVKLAGCLDSKATTARVQRDMAEGKRIDVVSTPTVFINGRMMVGLPSEDAYFQAIDAALNSAAGNRGGGRAAASVRASR